MAQVISEACFLREVTLSVDRYMDGPSTAFGRKWVSIQPQSLASAVAWSIFCASSLTEKFLAVESLAQGFHVLQYRCDFLSEALN